MAYEKFYSNIESDKLLKERDENLVFGRHCTREYEGEVNELGDQITIRGLGSPTIWQLQKDGTYLANGVGTGSVEGTGKDVIHKGIPGWEEIKNHSVKLLINQTNVWHFGIGRIDESFTKKYNLLSKYRQKTAIGNAEAQDRYIAKTIVNFADCESTESTQYTPSTGVYLTSGSAVAADAAAGTPAYKNILKFIDAQVQLLRERKIGDRVKLYGEVTPGFLTCLKQALISIRTDNTKLVDGREITPYNGIDFEMTNLAVVEGTEYCIIRTGDSVAFVDAVAHNDLYDVQDGFATVWKGFDLYDAGIIEPKACLFCKIAGYLA